MTQAQRREHHHEDPVSSDCCSRPGGRRNPRCTRPLQIDQPIFDLPPQTRPLQHPNLPNNRPTIPRQSLISLYVVRIGTEEIPLRFEETLGRRSAALTHARRIANTHPEESRAIFEDLWRQGYIRALEALGRFSLPHRVASIAVHMAPLEGRANLEWLLELDRKQLAAIEQSLATSPVDFRLVLAEAARILRDNKNCCLL